MGDRQIPEARSSQIRARLDRRPIGARSSSWARAVAGGLAARHVPANLISPRPRPAARARATAGLGLGGVVGLPVRPDIEGVVRHRTRALGLLALALALAGGGCSPAPPVPFSLDTPPLVLVPATLAGVTDARGRFREIYCAIQADHGATLPDDRPCEEALVRLADEPAGRGQPVELGRARRPVFRIVVVPGIFNECVRWLVSPLSDALRHLRRHGYRTETIAVSGTSGSPHNARQIRDALMAMTLDPEERVILVGYSKGTADSLEALVAFPEIVPRVAALVSLAGVVGGSPLADRIPDIYAPLLVLLGLPTCPPHDLEALASLRRSTRLAALARAPLPPGVRYFSVGGIVTADETTWVLRPAHRTLARIDGRNDGQVIFTDTVIPGGTLLGFVRADHWAIALPIARPRLAPPGIVIDHNAFPREVMLEAIVRAVEEAP